MFPFIEFFKAPQPAQITKPEPVIPLVDFELKHSSFLRVSEGFSVDLEPFRSTGERDAILASSGMGKSYLTGVLMEETLETGGLLCVIDPEGEHWTLGERYPILIIGGDHAALPLEEERFEEYFETVLEKGVSILFDLSHEVHSNQQKIYVAIVAALFPLEDKHKRKIRFVVDEARIYAPQKGMSVAKGEENSLSMSQNVAQLGRKRGIDSLWATQRPANINKDILSQCNRFWFGGISTTNDYNAIKSFLDDAGISLTEIRSLKRGEFLFFANGETTKLIVRKRHCRHSASTPVVDQNKPVASKKDLKAILEKLK